MRKIFIILIAAITAIITSCSLSETSNMEKMYFFTTSDGGNIGLHGCAFSTPLKINPVTGESIYSSEDLSIALDKLKSRITDDEETLEKLKAEDDQKKLLADSVMPAYRQFRSWAEEFEDASLETKKMIACQLFSRVEVGKGYRIKVTMNMTYRQFVIEWGGENMMTV